MEAQFITDIKDNVVYQILHHPKKKNALTPDLLEQLDDNLNQLSRKDNIRCLVIRGAGEQMFSSGYDIGAIPVADSDAPDQKPPDPLLNALQAVKDFPYPTIAMLNGHAFGAGFNLSVCCDIRIARTGVKVCMPPAKLGVAYHPEGLQQFIEAFGMGTTKEIFYTADIFQGRDLLTKGLVNHIVSPEDLDSFTHEYASKIAGNAPLSLKTMKKIMLLFEHDMNLGQADQDEAEKWVAGCFASSDLKEGQKAFMEKRKPKFTGV